MCGRFTQQLSWAELHLLADLIGQAHNFAPRFNIAPTTQIEVIRPTAGGNELREKSQTEQDCLAAQVVSRHSGQLACRGRRFADQPQAGWMNNLARMAHRNPLRWHRSLPWMPQERSDQANGTPVTSRNHPGGIVPIEGRDHLGISALFQSHKCSHLCPGRRANE
jgi:hypothetical protein